MIISFQFARQQEKHLGITNRTKREVPTSKDKPVKVYIHEVAKSPSNGNHTIEVLYHVTVSGRPVPANTAADDMRLVSDEEVVEELGYPFLIKAERKFQSNDYQLSLVTCIKTSYRNTLIFVLCKLLHIDDISYLLLFPQRTSNQLSRKACLMVGTPGCSSVRLWWSCFSFCSRWLSSRCVSPREINPEWGTKTADRSLTVRTETTTPHSFRNPPKHVTREHPPITTPPRTSTSESTHQMKR